ncbi:MAG: small ribosomal subunit Rsm22 family protein [Bdellovibrionota bacterium]
MIHRHLGLPPAYEARIDAELKKIQFDLGTDRKLADAVLRLSDFYIANPGGSTPWDEPWAQAASLAYYFPLNYCRALAVANEARRLGFFAGLEGLHDFGSGMGSAVHAFADVLADSIRFEASDVSREALDLSDALSPAVRRIDRAQRLPPEKSLLVASYVFTELQSWPSMWNDYEALAIIEPSTQNDARRLMAEREPLLERGYRFWGPCTHEQPCPLLVHSAKDWCHDRVHFDAPEWFQKIERHLPMKNRTLTFSYLLARRTPPPAGLRGLARMVGDTLEEKGKTRQALCRSSEREFLAWFPQRFAKGESLDIERGALVGGTEKLEKKSNEVRVKSPDDIELLPADRVV